MATAPNPYPISPFFSFRWVNENPVIDARYNTIPIDSLVDDGSYAQPWEQTDKGQIQYTNIFVPTCKLYTCDDIFVKDIVMAPISPPLINTDLICYNGEIDFSDVPVGRYYAKLTYTDENSVVQDWRTSPLDVELKHPGTLLYECYNNSNEKGAIFLNPDPIIINCRVAGMLRSPLPKSDTESYEDQYDDLTQLSSIPSENWTNLIGNSHGNVSNYFQIPWWVIQKFNLLYSLNNVLIDGQPFAKIPGAEFKPFRVENQLNEDAYWGIDIQPNAAYPNAIYETGSEPDGDYVVIYKKKIYLNVGANFSIPGIFTDDTNLVKVILFNNGANAFTLKLGTSLGGDEIRTFDIPADQVKNPLLVEYPFTGNTTLYLTGLNGTNCKIIVVYDDFLASNTPPGPAPGTADKWQKNTLYWFVENEADSFSTEFNAATGVGNVGTDHEGCVLAGTNGTLSVNELLVRGWDRTLPSTRQTIIGDNSVVLEFDNLPPIPATFGRDSKGGSSGTDVLSADQPGPKGDNHYDFGGSSDPIDVTNRALILPAFYYIGT